jgi:drug/metabolite transporter (DMT)-like permease
MGLKTSLSGASVQTHALITSAMGGILLLYLSQWVLSGLDASGKWLLSLGTPLVLLAWFRYFIHFVLITVLIYPKYKFKYFRSHSIKFQLVRAIFMLMATLLLFTTLSYLPQAQATAIIFLAPLLMLAASPWLLGEAPRASRWVAAIIGFCGVLIVIRPGSGLHLTGVMFGLLAAIAFSVQNIMTRRVARDHPFTTLIWSGLAGTLVLSAMMPFMWSQVLEFMSSLGAFDWLILISTGLTGAFGHLIQIQAYRLAPASVLAPFIYMQMTAAATIGWIIWGDLPDATTWLGIGIIFASGVGVGWFEWRNQATKSSPA